MCFSRCLCVCIYKIIRFLCLKILCIICLPVYRVFFSDCNQRRNVRCTSFICGFLLGQAYYYYLLKDIPFPYRIGTALSLFISVLLGIGNAISIQIRCICLLMLPMYCGKSGRGVLKAVVLTYVVAGPITNMGLNAKEVVRVFACSAQLSFNLSKERYDIMEEPFRKTAASLQYEINQMTDTLRTVNDIAAPIENEIEDTEEIEVKQKQSDLVDNLMSVAICRSKRIEIKYRNHPPKTIEDYFQKLYQKKLEYRCHFQLSEALAVCIEAFAIAYDNCVANASAYTGWLLCWPLKLIYACSFLDTIQDNYTCDVSKQINTGLGKAYVSLKKAKRELSGHLKNVNLKYGITYERQLYNIQDSKETGERVMHAFEEKNIIMKAFFVILNVCMALLFLRIVMAAAAYHDMYLTSIKYDNIYITGYFKKLDEKRKRRQQMTLLPLKKMERSKYIDVHMMSYKAAQHSALVTQILKVMLEVITATTFVMLDRLFFEALDVVRQHAQIDAVNQNMQDLTIEVEGTGILATLLRKLFSGVASKGDAQRTVTNQECLPQPRAMPLIYFFKIYGGYLWILILLYVNPYALRLRRLICSYFYPNREKQRVLHLYNDILKKRMKMQKTLRRKAVQAVRAHYLSSENLLSLRMKFPHVLGWLHTLPAARMTCLICGETEPRGDHRSKDGWHACNVPKCPFVYCNECWTEAGERCLACDPSLHELSDVDSLSEDDQPPN